MCLIYICVSLSLHRHLFHDMCMYIAIARVGSYFEMWKWHYERLEKSFPSHDFLYVKYEDLHSEITRVETLVKVSLFEAVLAQLSYSAHCNLIRGNAVQYALIQFNVLHCNAQYKYAAAPRNS